MISNSKDLLDDKFIIFYANDHIAFMSNKVDADYHNHNYIQITLGLEKGFMIDIEEKELFTKGIIVASNISHRLRGHNEWQLYLLINPESLFGETIKRDLLNKKEIYIIEDIDINKVIGNEVNKIETIGSEKYHSITSKLKCFSPFLFYI